jgi:ABC-type transporter Mla subunit MlaD
MPNKNNNANTVIYAGIGVAVLGGGWYWVTDGGKAGKEDAKTDKK